jgi:hypothetical protein
MVVAEQLERDEHGHERKRHAHTAAEPVADRALDERDDQQHREQRALLERVEKDVRRHDGRVQQEGDQPDGVRFAGRQRAARGDPQGRRRNREDARGDPDAGLVPGGVLVAEHAELEEREGNTAEADPGHPALDVAKPLELARHAPRSSMRSSAHTACSRSSGSSDSAYADTARRSTPPPTFPAAISALRRR